MEDNNVACKGIVHVELTMLDAQNESPNGLTDVLHGSILREEPTCLQVSKKGMKHSDADKITGTDIADQKAQAQEGEKSSSFSTCIIDSEHKDEILALLHSVIDYKSAKVLAHVIRSIVDMGIILKPTSTQLKEEFSINQTRSAYDKHMNEETEIPAEIWREMHEVFHDFITVM